MGLLIKYLLASRFIGVMYITAKLNHRFIDLAVAEEYPSPKIS